jgi:hypothetical protein
MNYPSNNKTNNKTDNKTDNKTVRRCTDAVVAIKTELVASSPINRQYIEYVCKMRDDFCYVNSGENVVLAMKTKDRNGYMRQQMINVSGFEKRNMALQREFWAHFRKCNPQFNEATITIIRKKCNNMASHKRLRANLSTYGVNRNGRLKKCSNPIPFQQGTFKDLPNHSMSFVPVAQVRSMSTSLLQEMKDLQSELILRIRGGAATRKKDARDSNRGHSVAYCVVGGGRHASKENRISGSMHINNNITGKGKLSFDRNNAAMMLQCRVFALVSKVIITLFGKTSWFKASMEKLSNIPRERLIPGGRIPCSHIWFTAEPKPFHVHTDTNTIPPAFVFCVETCIGGDLLVTLPNGEVQVVETSAGRVTGGKWAQLPHCNTPVISGVRHSFVCYLDHRAISSSWLCFTTNDGFEFYDTIVNELLQQWGL